MMNQTNANRQDELFIMETAGLPEVASPGVIRLDDGDRLDLRIGPVRKSLDGAELRILAYNRSGAAQAATPAKLPQLSPTRLGGVRLPVQAGPGHL
jgi:hypothetical protein